MTMRLRGFLLSLVVLMFLFSFFFYCFIFRCSFFSTGCAAVPDFIQPQALNQSLAPALEDAILFLLPANVVSPVPFRSVPTGGMGILRFHCNGQNAQRFRLGILLLSYS
jgi:hypothetical protein